MMRGLLARLFKTTEEEPPPDLAAFTAAKKRLRKTLDKACKDIEDNFGQMVVKMQSDKKRRTRRRRK